MAISYFMLFSMFSLVLANHDVGDIQMNVNISNLWSAISPLKLAAMEGSAVDVEAALRTNMSDVDERDHLQMTALHWAALGGHSGVVQLLLASGADPNSTDEDGNTALHLSSDPMTIESLILAGTYVDAQNEENVTALHLAVKKGEYINVLTFLKYGAKTDITDAYGRTPLDLAVLGNDVAIVRLLKSCGAKNVKYTSNGNFEMTTTEMTPTRSSVITEMPKGTRIPHMRTLTSSDKALFTAARDGSATKIAELCAEGIDPNIVDANNPDGRTPLHAASANGKTLAVLALIRCGANINYRDANGDTPLHIAVYNQHYMASDVLLLSGADHTIANKAGTNPYDLAQSSKQSNFRNSFNPNIIDWFVDSRSLSDNEKDLRTYTKQGRYIGVAKLCKKGIDVRVKNKDDKDLTALHYAVTATWHVEDTIQTLVKCGADVNSKDADGNTPLHVAVVKRADAAFTTLLLNNADLFIRNNEGRTPYQTGLESGTAFMKSLLVSPHLDWYQGKKMIL